MQWALLKVFLATVLGCHASRVAVLKILVVEAQYLVIASGKAET